MNTTTPATEAFRRYSMPFSEMQIEILGMDKDVLGTVVRPTDFSTAFKRHGRHFARYLFAAKLAPGKRVLDIACGGGFGSAYLAMYGQARSVMGMDLDDEILEHARAAF